MIDVYIGLALFRIGDFRQAAARWYEGMRNGISVGNVRGIAGSIEGCAYIAVGLGKSDAACRFLAAAEQIRNRTQIPLFSFWRQHNAEAAAALRASMGERLYEDTMKAGARMRQEDAINEAAALLRDIAARDEFTA